MERPQYSNAFSVTYNQQLGEFILNFAMEYPQIPQPNTPGIHETKTETSREDVCGLVLPKATAIQLIDIIGKALASEQGNE